MHPHKLLLAVLFASTTVMAAELPYAGKWKMNPAKSDFGQITTTYEQLPSGEMQATLYGRSYKFKMDGKDYATPAGNTAAWKSTSATTWESTWKLNGKVLYTDTVTLSSDGKTRTIHRKGTSPNGEAFDDTLIFERVSGGPGLAGKWKTKSMKPNPPELLELTPSGADGLTYKVVDVGFVCETKLDGKDYPCTGTTLASGWTMALAKSGARSFDMTRKRDGKVLFKYRCTVSPDGKTLTETGGATGTTEKIKVVFDRQ